MVKHNDSKQVANIPTATSQLVQATVPVIFQDTIPTQYQDASDKVDQAKKEALKALEEVNWEEIKKEMEFAKQQAMESIDWEKLKVDMAETRIHVDSIMQDFDFDFDFDFDIDMEEIRVEMEEVMRDLEEVDWEEIRTEMENVRIQLDSVLHSN